MKRLLAAIIAVVALSSSPARAVSTAPTLGPVLAAKTWLNGHPTAASLRGKVVLVDVFTFGCFNCKNVTPNLKKLNASGDLTIIGVHTPETAYERDRGNVIANLREQGIVWPVAIDNDMAIWHAYDTEYWPTQMIFDRHGVLRKTFVGDSQDAELDRYIAAIAAEK